jgi:hypothetical protein
LIEELLVCDAKGTFEEDPDPIGVRAAILGQNPIGQLNLAASSLNAVKPDLVQLAATRHFVAGHDADLITDPRRERSDTQVFTTVAVRSVVVVLEDDLCGATPFRDDLD